MAFFCGVIIGLCIGAVMLIVGDILIGGVYIQRCTCGANEGCSICAAGKKWRWAVHRPTATLQNSEVYLVVKIL
jgi:hypothetical protein